MIFLARLQLPLLSPSTVPPYLQTTYSKSSKLPSIATALQVEIKLGVPPGLPESLCNEESKLQALASIQARITVGVVSEGQVVICHFLGTTSALRHILSGHLQVDPTRVTALSFMHIKERP